MHSALASGQTFPEIHLDRLGGGTLNLGRPEKGGWQAIFVYRGLHCPICKEYLGELETRLSAFADLGIEVVAVSADPVEKARAFVEETGITLPVGIDLSRDQMAALGLYVSDPRSPDETDRPFAEPAFFLVNPEGALHMVEVSNAPFLRPGLDKLPDRIGFVLENDYPIRGTHAA